MDYAIRFCSPPAGKGGGPVGHSGIYQGRAFVALINLNAENEYRVTIRGCKGK